MVWLLSALIHATESISRIRSIHERRNRKERVEPIPEKVFRERNEIIIELSNKADGKSRFC